MKMCPIETLPRDGPIPVRCLALKALKHRAVTYRLATRAISPQRRTVGYVLGQGKAEQSTKMPGPITPMFFPRRKRRVQGTPALGDRHFGLKGQRRIYQLQTLLLFKILIRTLRLACLVFLRLISRATRGASCLYQTVQRCLSRRGVVRARKKVNLRGKRHPTPIPYRNLQ